MQVKPILFIICLVFSYPIHANVCLQQKEASDVISKLYHKLNKTPKQTMSDRLAIISKEFLGKKYLLGALGEGCHARFDQAPRYRTDAFDCETYVTTMLAIALANNTSEFKHCLAKLRYQGGYISYVHRNHFTSIDWNKNNQDQGFVQDITPSFKNAQGQPVAEIAVALIDKPSWYEHLPIDTIRLFPKNATIQSRRLAELKKRGQRLAKTESRLPYLPFTAIFNKNNQPNRPLFSQIPNGAIIEIVRPNWDLTPTMGTHLNISHIGFAFWNHGILFFREASSIHGQVVDVPLIEYLQKARHSPTIKGINVQVIVPKSPDCEISKDA